MAFRLKIDEPIAMGFRRIGVEQIDRARRELAAAADPAREIHEARKAIKRIRALLRLGREGLGEETFRAENDAFRTIAQSLAGARDNHVLLQTVATLTAEERGDGIETALTRLKTAILSARAAEADEQSPTEVRAAAETALEDCRRRFRKLKLEPDSFAALQAGFVRNYKKAVERSETAYTRGSDEDFHDWRKCVQTFWRHLALLSRAWPPLFEAHIEATRELSQILGEDHDLAMLRAKLAVPTPNALSREDTDALEALIRTRQDRLRRSARPLGEIVFAERPKAIGRRVTVIWEGAVKLNHAQARQEKAASTETPRAAASVQERG